MRLYTTWDSLEFQEAFHKIYWAEFDDYDSLLEALEGRRQVASYVGYFYDQVGALLRREKIRPVIEEARARSNDPRLYEHFEFLYEQMTRRAQGTARR